MVSVTSQFAWELHILGWAGFFLVTAYFCVASIALRWRPEGTRVVRYEPPADISPATAAYLHERGVNDKPLAVAFVNMAAKGYLRIVQDGDDYILSQSDPSVPLELEEDLIAKAMFAHNNSPVRLSQLKLLVRIARDVRGSLRSAVEPDLVSPHFPFFVPGLTISLWCFLAALCPEIEILWRSNGTSGLVLPALLSVWFLLATIRTLPATIYKLKSLLPGRSPYRMRFVKNDSTSLFLSLASMASLAVIGWATSTQFALLFAGFVVANVLGWMALRAPTPEGRVVLHSSQTFACFLRRWSRTA